MVVAGCAGVVGPPAAGSPTGLGVRETVERDWRQLVEQGVAAARRQDWDTAIARLAQAQRAAPAEPSVLFNLGLAHARASDDLPALAWLHAYLATTTSPPNETAVRAEISRLQRGALDRINKILEAALATAAQLPEANDRKYAEKVIAESWAGAGYLDAAGLVRAEWTKPEELQIKYIEGLAKANDFKAVRAEIAALRSASRDEAWSAIANALWLSGRTDEGRAAALNISGSTARSNSLAVLAIVVIPKSCCIGPSVSM